MANPKSSMQGLSSSSIVGIAIAATAALVLAVFLTVIFVRRRRNGDVTDEEKPPGMQQAHSCISIQYPRDTRTPNARTVLSVTKQNLTSSIVLPLPVPPVPAARPRPPKVFPGPALHPSGRPMTSQELLEYHRTAGTMPRPFLPHIITHPILTDELVAPRASFSRSSIGSPSLRNSLASFHSSSTGPREGSDALKVRHVFAPLLPDEIVLRQNEKVNLIRSFDDGWCVVGRKSPFHAPAPVKSNGYEFGQGTSSSEVEIGVVPLWVFEKRANGSTKPERPMRTESLGVTLLDQDQGVREGRGDVMSWSNF